MRNRVIGGEFELTELPVNVRGKSDYYSYASGRAALYQILMSIKPSISKVWLPDWLCESMIDAVARSGRDYGFYKLGPDLRMEVAYFVAQNRPISVHDVIVLVNYFGLVDVESTIEELRELKVDAVIIEDDVQALFSFFDNVPHAHVADYCFTSLRKSLAIPDGGLVKTKKAMPVVHGENTFSSYKLQGALRKGFAVDSSEDDAYLSLFKQGEDLIANNFDSEMSKESETLLAYADIKAAAIRRMENAQYLLLELEQLGIAPLLTIKENHVPLFVPILIDCRNEVRRALFEHDIFCPVHWPLREDMAHLSMGKRMAEKELSLVVDQRYNTEDMQCIVQVLKNAIWK